MILHAATDGHEVDLPADDVGQVDDYVGSTTIQRKSGGYPVQVTETPEQIRRLIAEELKKERKP